MDKKTVFVGMSGGVDSSVSAALLKKQGYEVVGVFIRTWHPDFLACNEEEERRDAIRVSAHLDIPFLTFDFEDIYKKEVADYMISEYKAGRTPNPDVMCNKEVKFGAFLKKAVSMGADYVATGHYAQKKFFNGDFFLKKGNDPSKDQSYFLWTLKQKQLSKILFPVGHLNKTQVRTIAKEFNLPVAQKKDSQGICFLGAVDLKGFLKHYIKEKKGKVFEIEDFRDIQEKKGKEIGYHSGVVFYTLGERHGFTVVNKKPNDKPYYVVGKNLKKNILYVSQKRDLENSKQIKHFYLELKDTNWISEIPKKDKYYKAQIRYHGELISCKIKIISKTKAQIIFENYVLVASGQSIVVYDRDVCLGGGIII